jgi:hypothetical protein
MLGRPHRVAPLLANIREQTPGAHVLFMLTPGDRDVRGEVNRSHAEWREVQRLPAGDYARKINRGYRTTSQPYVFTAADDLQFHPGWYEAARALMTERIGVVGTNDLGSPRVIRGEHSTHSLIARWYADLGTIDQPNKIYHEGYAHEYVDDELVATARKRNAWAFAPDSIVEHLHPDWGKAPSDPMYAQQRARMRRSRALFHRRNRLWA